MRTIPLPKYIPANCTAGINPRLTVCDDGRHIVHPGHYDPAKIDAEDLEHDCCIRLLDGAEVAIFEADGFGPGTLDVLLDAEARSMPDILDAVVALTDGRGQAGYFEAGAVTLDRQALAALVRVLRGGAQ